MNTQKTQKKGNHWIGVIIILVIVLIAILLTQKQRLEQGRQDNPQTTISAPGAGSYESYSAEKISRAQTGDVVLFFHAPWCPTCRTADANIQKNISEIPENVTILKTDYDTNSELKTKYGVRYQHTFVQVDASGNEIVKWSGSNTLADILKNIQ